MNDDRRLIEDYLPIQPVSDEARIENSVTQARGYLSKALLSILHRWWARRPLVACRAVVYAALVPAGQFRPENGPEGKRDSLARANAAKFLENLCRRTVTRKELEVAAGHIREANGGQPPRVLDQFAGGGSIPLEAARLGCEAYALELNPVAHLVELATLVYPSRYGKRLVDEVRRWSGIVFERTRAEVEDLYAPVPDPKVRAEENALERQGQLSGLDHEQRRFNVPHGYLLPLAYLWTRTVPCKKCGAIVALHRQTWLRKKKGGFVAIRPVTGPEEKRLHYQLLESKTDKAEEAIAAWGFDPTDLSHGGETECPFCQTTVTSEHLKDSSKSGRLGRQLVAIVAEREGERGKVYLPVRTIAEEPDEAKVDRRLAALMNETGLTLPDEPLQPVRPSPNARGVSAVTRFELKAWHQLFTPRQLLALLTFIKHLRRAHGEMIQGGVDADLARATTTYLAFILDKVAERGTNVCRWHNGKETIESPIANGKMPMVWDFPEANPFAEGSGSWAQSADDVLGALEALAADHFRACTIQRGSALSLPYGEEFFDAVVTDPPYYDNVPYADLSDFFYVWLRRSVGDLYPEHFAPQLTPKRGEATALSSRHGGDMEAATKEYEAMMAQAFAEARRVLKPGAPLVCVYAHKTTSGWTTLVEALRQTGFVVTEAWPIDLEMEARLHAKEAASLASNIFLVARKRDGAGTGSYEDNVRPDLERIVRERVETLWEMGISGPDLVIAAVGAGLRAFTRFARVEYANGEEVPAGRFLAEVEGVVLETLLEKIFSVPRSGVAAVDGPSRFYVLWRYTYKAAELDGGEAIVFTYGQGVELDGPKGLSSGNQALAEKKKGKYRLRDYTERGADDRLGLPADNGAPAPLVDALHRILWLVEYEPRSLIKFLDEARPDRERLRLVAQALAGAGLKGKSEEEAKPLVTTTASEQAALEKLLANWKALIEAPAMPLYDRRREA